MKKKSFVILVQLLLAGMLFFSCNKSEVIDYSLPIRLELPYCGYSLDSLDNANKDAILSIDLRIGYCGG